MNTIVVFLAAALLLSWSTYSLGEYAYSAVSLGLAALLGWASLGLRRARERSKSS